MSFNGWEEVKLSDIAIITMGQSPKGEFCNNNGEGAPLLNGPTEFGTHNPYPTQFTTDIKKSAKKGDLLFCVRGSTTGRMNWADREYAIGRGIASIAPQKDKTEHFIRGIIEMKLPELLQSATGSTFPNVSRGMLTDMKIEIPTYEEMIIINKILLDIDDKIEVNNKINKRLEEMAHAIFKQWFVDFEFPNEEGNPYKSSGGEIVESELGMIPKNWIITEFSELVKVYNGYSYKGTDLSQSNDAMVTIKNFDRNGGYKSNGLKEIVISDKVKEHHYVDIGDIIVAHTDLTQGAEIIGNPIIITSKLKYEKLIMSMDTVKVKSIKDYIGENSIYMILKDIRFKKYALGHVNGTTVLHLSKKCIPGYKLVIPSDKSVFKEFEKVISSLINNQINIIKQNESLMNLRDTLLPKLMSGEIRVNLD